MAAGRNKNWSASFRKHERVVTVTDDISLTRQEFQDECDINVLMSKYKKSGVLPWLNNGVPQYLDVTDVPDLMTARNTIIAAEQAFASLPADVRRTFDNDAAEFVKFASDRENLGQMREWGLAPPEKAPEAPISVRVMPEPAPEPGAS